MAGKVRGISIELSADTSGIVKGLKGADSAIRKTQKELRDINRLLKLDPTNMTLLKQRTQGLQTQISQTSDKLKQLKDLEKQMKSEGVDENSEQFKALQREIIATEQELKKLRSTAGSGSAKLLQISNAAKKMGDGLQNAGKKLLPLTAGITALGAASVKMYKEVDQGADTVIKKTGATGDAAKELKDIYEQVATSVTGTFEEAGKAVGEINTRFGLTGKELESMSEEFMKFAKITDQDVESAVIGVDMALKTFGLNADDAEGALGLLAKTSQDTGISVETLESLLQNSGDQLKEFGLGFGESVQLMGNFEKSGLDSNKMLSKLSKAAAYFNKKGKNMKTGLQDIIDRLKDSSTEADATAEAYKIFGTKGGLAFVTAAKEGKLAFDNLSDDLSAYKNVVGDTYDEIIDETDKMELVWKQTKVALADAGKTILNVMAPALQKLSDFLKNLSTKWKNLDDGTKKMVIGIAGVVAAVGPALIILGKLATAISAVTKVMSTAKFMAFLTNPVTLAIAAVAGLAAGLYALKKAYDKANNPLFTFKERTKEVKDANDELARSIEESNKQLEDNITQADLNAASAENLKNVLDDLIEKEDKTASDKERIKDIVEELNKIVPNLNLAYDEQADALNKTNQEIESHIGLMKQEMIAESYRDAWTKAINEQTQAQMNLSDAQDNFNQMLEQAPDDLKELYKIYKQYGNEAEMFADGYGDQLLRNGDALRDLAAAEKEVKTAQDNVTESAGRADKIYQQWTEQAELLSQAQADFNLENVRNQFKQTFGDEYTAELDAAITKAVEAGVEIPESIANNIADGKGSVEGAITQINKAISLDKARKRMKKDGSGIPSDVADALNNGKGAVQTANTNLDKTISIEKARQRAQKDGSGVPSDAAAAMEAGKGKVEKAAGTLVDSADVSKAEGNAKTAGENTAASFATGISSGETAAGTAAAGLVTAAQNNMSGSAYSLGQTFGYSYGDGLESAGWYVGRIAAGLVDKVKGAIQNAQKSGSPSKVAMSLGDDFGEGYVIGLEDSIKAARKAAQALVSTPSTLAPMGYNRASSGAVSNQYIYNQTNNSPAALTPSEIYRQSKNLLNLKGASV